MMHTSRFITPSKLISRAPCMSMLLYASEDVHGAHLKRHSVTGTDSDCQCNLRWSKHVRALLYSQDTQTRRVPSFTQTPAQQQQQCSHKRERFPLVHTHQDCVNFERCLPRSSSVCEPKSKCHPSCHLGNAKLRPARYRLCASCLRLTKTRWRRRRTPIARSLAASWLTSTRRVRLTAFLAEGFETHTSS